MLSAGSNFRLKQCYLLFSKFHLCFCVCYCVRPAQDMSELLYYLSVWDKQLHRIPPLVFTIRHWARCSGVTHSNPGHWLSNFMLTMLIVHFLQTRPKPVLPSLKSLESHSGNAVLLANRLFGQISRLYTWLVTNRLLANSIRLVSVLASTNTLSFKIVSSSYFSACVSKSC